MANTSRILRLSEVIKRTGRSRSSIYVDMKAGVFPEAINLGARAVGWLESEVDEWIDKCVEQSRSHQGV